MRTPGDLRASDPTTRDLAVVRRRPSAGAAARVVAAVALLAAVLGTIPLAEPVAAGPDDNFSLTKTDNVGGEAVGKQVLSTWGEVLAGLESNPDSVAHMVDWVAKRRILNGFRERHDCQWDDSRLRALDLQYHDIHRQRSLFYRMQRKGLVERICDDHDIATAVETPPQTTRARLRGEFIRKAKERRRDFTVDWVHLKLNDQAQRTVLCKDPFKNEDERVEKLIESL